MTRMRKSGRKPRRRKVIWLGTVQMRAFIGKRIALKESKWKGKSGESWGQEKRARYSVRERPILRWKTSAMEGIEPEGSSREMRSTRVMGKKTVGRPTRSASGSLS